MPGRLCEDARGLCHLRLEHARLDRILTRLRLDLDQLFVVVVSVFDYVDESDESRSCPG